MAIHRCVQASNCSACGMISMKTRRFPAVHIAVTAGRRCSERDAARDARFPYKQNMNGGLPSGSTTPVDGFRGQRMNCDRQSWPTCRLQNEYIGALDRKDLSAWLGAFSTLRRVVHLHFGR